MNKRWMATTTAAVVILTLNVGAAHAASGTEARTPSASETGLDPVAAVQGYADFMNQMVRVNPTMGQSGRPTSLSANQIMQAYSDFMNQMLRANPTLGHS